MENTILDFDEVSKTNDYRDHLAPKWKRFINLMIDFYLVYLGTSVGFAFWLVSMREVSSSNSILFLISPYLSVLLLYFFSELYFNKTIGKLITGTKVISVFDDKPSTKQILIRTLCRIVPFEPFSLLFGYTAWHDDWSDTAVVKDSFN